MRRAIRNLCLLGLLALFGLPPLSAFGQKTAAQSKELADGLYARQVYDLAIREYESIVADHPTFGELDVVYYRLGEAYGKTGDKAKSQKAYADLLAKFPKSAFAARSSLRRAEQFMANKEYDKALLLLGEVVRAKPDANLTAAALFYTGRSQLALKREALAQDAFKQVTTNYAQTPYASLASLEYARLLQSKVEGKELDADTEAELLRLFRIALQQPASDEVGGEAQFQLANVLYRSGKFAEAAAAYDKLSLSWPSSPRVAESRLPSAWCQFNTGSARGALELLEAMDQKSRLKSPGEWLYLKANCQRQLKDYEAAAQSYGHLVKSAPNSSFTPAARYERTLILYDLKKFEEVAVAAKELEQVPKLKENALWLQAQAHNELKQGEKAAAVYGRIAAEFPKSGRAREALLASAQGYEQAEKFDEAVTSYQAFAKTYPKDPLAARLWYSIGLARLKQGKVDQAVAAWKKLAEKFPKDDLSDDGLFQGAITLYRQDEKEQAEDLLGFLLENIPDSEHAHNARFYRAVLMDEKKDQLAAAGKAWAAFVEANPPEEIRRQGLHRLGLNLYRQGKFDEAATSLAAAADTAEGKNISPALLLWLCQQQEEKKNYASAIRVANQLIAAKDIADRERQIAWWVIGRSEDGLGRSALAIEAFTKCIDVKINTVENTEAALRLGELLRDAGKTAEAQRALTIAGTSASALGQLREQGRSYMLLGDVSRAEKDWKNAARFYMSVAVLFDDKDLTPEALYRAAEAFGKQGRTAERDRNLAELKERYPDSKQAGQTLK